MDGQPLLDKQGPTNVFMLNSHWWKMENCMHRPQVSADKRREAKIIKSFYWKIITIFKFAVDARKCQDASETCCIIFVIKKQCSVFSVQCPVPRAQCSFFLIRCFTHEWPWHPALTIITISSIVYTHTIFSSTAAVRFTCLPPYGIQWHYACKVTIPNPTSAKVITSHPDPYHVPCNEKSVRWDINL